MKTQSRRSFIVWLLIAITAFLGFSAVVSGAMLMIAPDGSLMGMPVSTRSAVPGQAHPLAQPETCRRWPGGMPGPWCTCALPIAPTSRT